MSNISVAEILKICGKWMEGKPFSEFVAEKKKITVRHAYNLIKNAADNHEILRIPLPNRTVLYGLPEFGYPQKNENKDSDSIKVTKESEVEKAKAVERAILIDALIGYHKPEYFRKLSEE